MRRSGSGWGRREKGKTSVDRTGAASHLSLQTEFERLPVNYSWSEVGGCRKGRLAGLCGQSPVLLMSIAGILPAMTVSRGLGGKGGSQCFQKCMPKIRDQHPQLGSQRVPSQLAAQRTSTLNAPLKKQELDFHCRCHYCLQTPRNQASLDFLMIDLGSSGHTAMVAGHRGEDGRSRVGKKLVRVSVGSSREI